MDSVAACLGAHVDDGVADAMRLAEENLILLDHAQGENVDKRVAGIRFIKDAFAAHGGHAEAVAVMRNAADDAFDDAAVAGAVLGIIKGAEAQRIEDGDGPRPHRENVAQDAADAGGRALEGLDEARVIVAFDLKRDAQAVADVDNPGVFTRAEEHVFAACGKLSQVDAGTLVGAKFSPSWAASRT